MLNSRNTKVKKQHTASANISKSCSASQIFRYPAFQNSIPLVK